MKKLTFVILKICLSLNKPFGHSTPHIGKGRILDNYVIKSNKCNQCAFASSYAGNLRQHLKTHSGEKSNKCSQCDYASSRASVLKAHFKMHGRKFKQMRPVWLCILAGKQFEETFENAQWRKVKQMQPVWLCILTGKQFEETFENAQWRKVNATNATLYPHRQAIWGDISVISVQRKVKKYNQLCILSCRQCKETFEITQWWGAKQIAISVTLHLSD